jgi:myo-inositol 2-dehydrogenase/D-chiro-inositol 1-dehydrogenase
MTLNVGVIGVGMIGQDDIRRLTTVLAGANVVAVSDANATLAKEVAGQLAGTKVYATGEELNRGEGGRRCNRDVLGPDACDPRSGGDQGGQAHLLREAACRNRGRLFSHSRCGSRFRTPSRPNGLHGRFDGQYRAMKETITSGAIGAPLIFHSGHRNPSVPGYYTQTTRLTIQRCTTSTSRASCSMTSRSRSPSTRRVATGTPAACPIRC